MIKLYENNPDINKLDQIAKCLKDGGVIIYPTDTVYAFGCDIFQARAVEKICKIKGIDHRKAKFSMICDDISQISEYAKFDNNTFKLLKSNLPGPITFVLDGNNNLPKVLKERKTIGIRVPDNNIAISIIKNLGNPILSSSLMFSNDEPEYSTDPELISEKYIDIVDLIVDGGYGGQITSTIVDCTSQQPQIIRQGEKELVD